MKNLVVSLSMLFVFFGDANAIEIHAPWIPGETWDCDRITSGFHQGVDDKCVDFNNQDWSDKGSPTLSVADGRVVTSEWSNSYGWYVWIEESDGSRDIYAHFLQRPFVSVGERVKTGQVIGICGCTPDGPGGIYCGGYHLHYGHYVDGLSQLVTIIDGQTINPDCCSQVISRNTTILDQAYARYGPDWIGYPEYQMWDLGPARQANPNHPWYEAWNTNNRSTSQGMSKNCVIWHFDGGAFGDNAVVYDALGGARAAIVLHSGFWIAWTNANGPNSPVRMPIRDESNVPANLRSYYREHYKKNGVTHIDGITAVQECADGVMLWNGSAHFAWYPHCAPGYFSDGWHTDDSYLFVECFNRNGGSQKVGHAMPVGQSPARVHNWNGFWVQDFGGSTNGSGIVMYDPNNALLNECATNEAYYLYGEIWSHYKNHGSVDLFGCPTTDRFDHEGLTVQDFHNRWTDTYWRIKSNGSHEELDPCGESGASGGGGVTACIPDPNSLIANGDFSSGWDCWETVIWPPEHGQKNLVPPMAEFRIFDDGDIWSMQLCQTLPQIQAGDRLVLIYDQRTVRTVRAIVSLTDYAGGEYINCGLWKDYQHPPGTGWVEYRIPFTGYPDYGQRQAVLGFWPDGKQHVPNSQHSSGL